MVQHITMERYSYLKARYSGLIQAGKFMIVGVMNTLVDIVIYFTLTRFTDFFPDHITTSRILSFLGGSVCSFILNRLWTFQKRDRLTTLELIRFYATILMSLLIGVVSMKLLIDVFHLYDLIALGLSVIVTFIWNFTLSKIWVFKKKSH
jgi:putative flippase GtrA